LPEAGNDVPATTRQIGAYRSGKIYAHQLPKATAKRNHKKHLNRRRKQEGLALWEEASQTKNHRPTGTA
jgi:hypothetical protein